MCRCAGQSATARDRQSWGRSDATQQNANETKNRPPRPAPLANRCAPSFAPASSARFPCLSSLRIASASSRSPCSCAERRSVLTHVCGKAAICCASSSAAARAAPLGTTRFARPICSASFAFTGRPVRIRSSARESPISRGSRTVPPSISGTPQRRQNTPRVASSATTRRSHQSESSSPPATACPSMAAITGFSSISREGPIGPSPSGETSS